METGFYSSVWWKDKRKWTEIETRKDVSRRIQGKTFSPWEQWSTRRQCTVRMCYLFAWIFTGSVRIGVTPSDLIAEPALRRKTCPTWTTWFMLDGGGCLPCSDLPKAAESSFPFLQLWVQDGTDRRYDCSWISFFLLPLGESFLVLVLQDDVLRKHSRICPHKGMYPQMLQAVLHKEHKRRSIWI